jgi:uncharacterized protein (TIGR03437 family)
MAYVHFGEGSTFEHRTDNTNIQFYLVSQAAAGLNNADGKTWIPAGSDIPGAAAAALNTWSQVTTATVHFAPLQMTNTAGGTSGQNTIIFDDTTENRQLLGAALAVTLRYGPSDTVQSTNVVFSPLIEFSTDLSAGTYDFQSVLTHELGHSLGADHTGVLSAVMFQASAPQRADQRVLSQDDLAFVTETYPAQTSIGQLGYGTITGNVQDPSGNFLRGALITAQDPVTGKVVGTLSNLTSGYFTFIVPAGSYRLWAEPLTGLVTGANLYLSATQKTDTSFQVGAAGGIVAVAAGAVAQGNIVTQAGVSPIAIKYAAALPAGQDSVELYSGPSSLPSGQEVVFIFEATGLGVAFSSNDIGFQGPVTIVPGSVLSLGKNQYQMVLDIPPVSTVTAASMIIDYNGSSASYSGGFVIEPVNPQTSVAGVGNAFDYTSGAVAPGEIVAIFGTNVGPAAGLAGALNAGGDLANSLAGIQVTFDGVPAPIFFASAGQINVEVPYEVAGKSSTSMLVMSGISAGAPVTIPVLSAEPGLFPVALNPDGTLNSKSNPARVGQYISLYATGLGDLAGISTGQIVPGAAAAAGVSVAVDGVTSSPEYAGSAPGFTGLDQVNVVGLTAGQHALSVSGAGQTSQTIAVWAQ